MFAMKNQTQNRWISRSDALPISQRDSLVSKAITRFICVSRVLHTERVIRVESVLHEKRKMLSSVIKIVKKYLKEMFRRRLSQTHLPAVMWYFFSLNNPS